LNKPLSGKTATNNTEDAPKVGKEKDLKPTRFPLASYGMQAELLGRDHS
jgi:hypothetical protein